MTSLLWRYPINNVRNEGLRRITITTKPDPLQAPECTLRASTTNLKAFVALSKYRESSFQRPNLAVKHYKFPNVKMLTCEVKTENRNLGRACIRTSSNLVRVADKVRRCKSCNVIKLTHLWLQLTPRSTIERGSTAIKQIQPTVSPETIYQKSRLPKYLQKQGTNRC